MRTFYTINFDTVEGETEIRVQTKDYSWASPRVRDLNGKRFWSVDKLVEFMFSEGEKDNVVQNVEFYVSIPSDEFRVFCVALAKLKPQLEMVGFSVPLSVAHVASFVPLIRAGHVSGLRVTGKMDAGAKLLAKAVQETDAVQHLDVRGGSGEIYVQNVTRPVDLVAFHEKHPSALLEVMSSQPLRYRELHLYFKHVDDGDAETLCRVLTVPGNTVRKLTLRFDVMEDGEDVREMLQAAIDDPNSEISEVRLMANGSAMYITPRNKVKTKERQNLQGVFALLSARQVKRVGNRSELRRVPKGIVQMIGQRMEDFE